MHFITVGSRVNVQLVQSWICVCLVPGECTFPEQDATGLQTIRPDHVSTDGRSNGCSNKTWRMILSLENAVPTSEFFQKSKNIFIHLRSPISFISHIIFVQRKSVNSELAPEDFKRKLFVNNTMEVQSCDKTIFLNEKFKTVF